jgi:predicted amino acid dehydrogenase
MPAHATARVTGVVTPDGRETEGWLVAVPLLPEQMLALPREEIYARVVRAVEIGAELGAQVAGLGAFTAVIGDGGITIAERSPIPVTTGNSLTIAAGVASLFRAAKEMEIVLERASVAVIGATGSIGAACVRLIASHAGRVTLVARNETRLRNFFHDVEPELPPGSSYTTDLRTAVREASVILTATSSTQDIVEPEDVQPGAVICELSLPHDVSRRIATERPDVLVIEGGNMRMPGTPRMDRVLGEGQFDFGLPPGTALACLSETMVLALEERLEPYTLGRGIDLDKVVEIERLARGCGFELADMRAFDRAVTQDDLAKIREARRISFAR